MELEAVAADIKPVFEADRLIRPGSLLRYNGITLNRRTGLRLESRARRLAAMRLVFGDGFPSG
jgi:hypothetical protein